MFLLTISEKAIEIAEIAVDKDDERLVRMRQEYSKMYKKWKAKHDKIENEQLNNFWYKNRFYNVFEQIKKES